MKKLLLSVAIASTLGLSGCGGGDNIAELKQEAIDNGNINQPYSRISFDPAKSIVSVPNDLLFSGTTDGTLNMPGESVEPGMSIDYADPSTALGALDGWSTSVPFSIAVDVRDGVKLDSDSLIGAVRIFEATLGGPLSPDAECAPAPAVSVCKMNGVELAFGADFVTKINDDGDGILVVPTKPLKAGQAYLIVITNDLMDSNGNQVQGSTSYESVRRDIKTLPLPLEAQLGLQYLVNTYETAAEGVGVNKESIIYTAAFTTQSISNVLETVKSLMVRSMEYAPAVAITGFGPHPYGAGAGDVLVAAQQTTAGSDVANFANLANVRVAKLTAPYYLGEVTTETCIPTAEVPFVTPTTCAGLFRGFKAQGDSPVSVSGARLAGVLTQESFEAQFDAQAIYFGLTEYSQPSDLVGMSFFIDPDGMRIPLDSTRHLTKFNPVPASESNDIDVLITMPNLAYVNGFRLSKGMDTISQPDTGWPIMIYSHGITTNKETTLAFAGQMALQGVAVMAIDHPYHGSRGAEYLGGKINASDGDVTAYLNLVSLLAARDNLRQSEADLLALRLAINLIDQSNGLDVTNVSFYGHSLGGITGVPFTALANSKVTIDFGTGDKSPNNPYAIKAASFLAPGGGVPGFLLESHEFAGTVKAGLTASSSFQEFLEHDSGLTAEELAEKMANDEAGYADDVNIAYGKFAAQFNFAAQTILDSGDAINYATAMGQNTNAFHVMEVIDDLVIPNATALPLAGTDPLVRLMGLFQNTTETVTAEEGEFVQALVKFKHGHHSSLLRPNVDAEVAPTAEEIFTTLEMQSQLAGFIKSGGTKLTITDSSVIAD